MEGVQTLDLEICESSVCQDIKVLRSKVWVGVQTLDLKFREMSVLPENIKVLRSKVWEGGGRPRP